MAPNRKNHPPAQDALHVLEEDKNYSEFVWAKSPTQVTKAPGLS